jgi:hypothetical protein
VLGTDQVPGPNNADRKTLKHQERGQGKEVGPNCASRSGKTSQTSGVGAGEGSHWDMVEAWRIVLMLVAEWK